MMFGKINFKMLNLSEVISLKKVINTYMDVISSLRGTTVLYMYVCMYVYMYVCMYVCMCVCVFLG